MAEQDATGRWSKNTGEALGEADRFCAEIQLKLHYLGPRARQMKETLTSMQHVNFRDPDSFTVLKSWSGPSLNCSSICL